MISSYIKGEQQFRCGRLVTHIKNMDFYNNHHAINNNNNHNGYNDASNLYYADPLNYGPAYGYSISSFMANRYVRLSWAAFFALWVYWGLLWFLRHAFGDGHQGLGYPTRQQQDESIEAAEGAAAHQPTATRGGWIGWIGWMRRPRVAHTHVSKPTVLFK